MTVAGLIVGLAATGVGVVAGQAPPTVEVSTDDVLAASYRADVTIRQEWVDADGRRLTSASRAQTYHLERAYSSQGWTTTMTLADAAVAPGASADRVSEVPFVIQRMVHDERRGLRLFDARGELVRPPGPADRRLLQDTGDLPPSREVDDLLNRAAGRGPASSGPPSWVSHLVVERAAVATRRALLGATLGPPVDETAGFDRHLIVRPNGLTEVFVDAAIALPVEINVVRGAELVARTRLGYTALGDRLLVRQRVLAEQVASGGRAGRLITDLEISNVTIEAGGGQ